MFSKIPFLGTRCLILGMLLVPILGTADIEHLKDFKVPIKCYPIVDGSIDKGNPVILYWINLEEIYPKLVFKTMKGKRIAIPNESYICEQ